MQSCYIALGSNLDNPINQVNQAIIALKNIPECCFIAQSAWYKSAPVGPGQQPDYINGVVHLESDLQALDLLDQLQRIEQQQNRQRLERWGPRTLDLDLLLYGNQVIDHPRLAVPHPRMKERNFVLLPLSDLAPSLTLPDGCTLPELMHSCPVNGIHRLDGDV